LHQVFANKPSTSANPSSPESDTGCECDCAVAAGAENVGKEAWIQNQANRPQAEAGELLQSLQGYMQQPPAQNAQYGYGAMPQQQPPLVTTEVRGTAPPNLCRAATPPLVSHCSRIFPGQPRPHSHCCFLFFPGLLSESSSMACLSSPRALSW
jgi:hypothetical protein